MPLDKTQQDLYSGTNKIQSRPKNLDQLDPRSIVSKENNDPNKKQWSQGDEVTSKQKKLLIRVLAGFGIFVLIFSLGYILYLYQKNAFSKENFKLTFDVPETINAGEEFSFKLLFHNNNRKNLINCALAVNHPEKLKVSKINPAPLNAGDNYVNFQLPEIKAYENGVIAFYAQIPEKEENTIDIEASLSCQLKQNEEPQEIQYARQSTAVKSSKIILQFESTRQAASQDVIEYFLKLKNNTDQNINSTELRITYPLGFEFISSTAAAADTENSAFKFATITPRQEIDLKISGTIKGSAGEKKQAKAQAGIVQGDDFVVISEEFTETEITTSPLSIDQIISSQTKENIEAVDPGESLDFIIKYKNNSELPLRDAVVTAKIEGRAIDYNSIQAQSGNFDGNLKTITWRPGEVPALGLLDPQEQGEISFKLKTLSHLPSDSLDDKNFSVSSTAQIDSPDIPTPVGMNKTISSSKKSVKINTKVIFEAFGVYSDSLLPGTGPIPPRIGEETTYTIHYKITNINNDISNTIVKTTLPDYVLWKNSVYPTRTEQLTFDERSKELTWNISSVPALSGTQLGAKEIAFQISITPQEHQFDQELILINQSSFSCQDKFTGKNYQLTQNPVSTLLPNDPSVGQNQATVSR
ncbi:MAG: hypothetical protein ABIC19_03555 [Patescibacteria group bacterium]|nr:hypothetical protein [Patescibacteria group bacterium]